MKILITNDDSVAAPCLNYFLETLSDVADVYIVAPSDDRSATGHTLSLRDPVKLRKINDRIYSLSGFPADCTYLGINALQKEWGIKFDLIISGINRGANLGQDLFYSGTAAAAREASFLGVPALATSLVIDFSDNFEDSLNDYRIALAFIKELICKKIHQLIPSRFFLNINFPHLYVKGTKITTLGFRNYRSSYEKFTDPRGSEFYWVGGKYHDFLDQKDSDCKCIDDNFISVSPISYPAQVFPFTAELTDLLNTIKIKN